MKASSSRPLILAAGVIALAFLAMPAFAQDAEKMQELQRIIDAQQKQMEAQQKQLDAQRQLLQDLQKQMESLVKDADTDTEEVPVATEKPPAKPADTEEAPVATETPSEKQKEASTEAPTPVEKVVTSGGGERVHGAFLFNAQM